MTDGVDQLIAYYDRHAARFEADTGHLDLSVLYERFLQLVPQRGRILDAGCGVGRDAQAFLDRGFAVEAIDASAEMVRLAQARVGKRARVQHTRFEEINWREEFDGIWACASLLHVPVADLPAIAARLSAALRPGGVCYMSFKYGAGERLVDGRYFGDQTEASLPAAVARTGLVIKEAWITADLRARRADEQWLNALAVRADT